MEEKKSKKRLFIGLPTYAVLIAAIVLICLFAPKGCAKAKGVNLNVSCNNATVDNNTLTYPAGSEVKLTFKSNDGYYLPNDISVTANNKQLVKDTDYTYSSVSGVFSFNIEENTDIKIDAVKNDILTFEVDLTHYPGCSVIFRYDPNKSPIHNKYPGLIDWGDGVIDNNLFHSYISSSPKIYKAIIYDYTYEYFSFEYSESALEQNYCVSSVNLPPSVKIIPDHAFNDCYLLKSISLPSSISSIGNAAFSGCYSFTSFEIPNGVTSIGSYVFGYCYGLKSVVISKNVNSIGQSLFVDCDSLCSLKVDPENTTFDSRNDCNAIIDTRTNTLLAGCGGTIIPSDVVSLADYAFDGVTSLKNIFIPKNISKIGQYAFGNCYNLDSFEFENGINLSSIEQSTFSGCSSLLSIGIPSSVTKIEDYAFSSCSSLKTFGLKQDSRLTSIGNNAFSGCSSLSSIFIPKNVSSISNYAFSSYPSLNSIVVDKQNANYTSGDNDDVLIERTTHRLFIGSNNAAVTIPDGIVSIEDYAFSSLNNVVSITIPTSVTSIGTGAFLYCTSLSFINIPNNVSLIDYDAFNSIKADAVIDMSSVDHLIILDFPIFCEYSYDSYIKFEGTIKVKSSLLDEYKSARYWQDFAECFVGV